jgi:hypothetical protein
VALPSLTALPALRSRDWFPWATSVHNLLAALVPGTWQALPLVIAATGFVTGHGCTYRLEGGRVHCTGWAQAGTSGFAAGAGLLSTALPAAYRPTASRTAWAMGVTTPPRPFRLTIGTDGIIVSADAALTAGQFINWENVTWPIG